MRGVFVIMSLAVMTAPAFATSPTSVPEMDAGAGFAALALLAGAAAIVRERSRRK